MHTASLCRQITGRGSDIFQREYHVARSARSLRTSARTFCSIGSLISDNTMHNLREVSNCRQRQQRSVDWCGDTISRSVRVQQRRYAASASASTKEPPAGLQIMEWTGDEDQMTALENLRKEMSATPYGNAATDEQLRWFLLDRKLQVEAAKDKLCTMLQWREEFG